MGTHKKVILTGIKPTGYLHLGNYFGAIKPALLLDQPTYRSQYFIADYHALNALKDPHLIRQYTLAVASSWLACGLDPKQVFFYRQSDVPEIFELTIFLMAFTAKGLMNRAHAYKVCVEENLQCKNPPDHSINLGLFSYPILMAADILLFDAEIIPVGRDQKQHLDIITDIAQTVNHYYKRAVFKIPEFYEHSQNDVIGLDGRKMSKSYCNTIYLFSDYPQVQKCVKRIVTNSQTVEEKKAPDQCIIFTLYKLFATPEQQKELANHYYNGGMAWSYAKSQLIEILNEKLSNFRERYNYFSSRPDEINDILNEGGKKIRCFAQEKMDFLRSVAGFSGVS